MITPLQGCIQKLDFRSVDIPLNESFKISGGGSEVARILLLRWTSDSGEFGWGEAAPFPAYDGYDRETVVDSLKAITPLLDDIELRDIYRISDTLGGQIPGPLLAALEMAWFDLKGRIEGIPVYEIFGGIQQEELKTGITVVVGDSDHAERSAMKFQKQGFRRLKIKIQGDVELDIARIEAVHRCASDAQLLLDANCGYSKVDAVRLVSEIEKRSLPVSFIEQLFDPSDSDAQRSLSEFSSIPMLADESCTRSDEVLNLIQKGGFDGINLKTQKSGVLEAVRMQELAQKQKARLMIGGMVESPLSMTFSAHLATSLGGFDWIDLDTPLFMPDHPFSGGIDFKGDIVLLNNTAGHGVVPTDQHRTFVESDWATVWQKGA